MSLDRKLQLEILRKLEASYPAAISHIQGSFESSPDEVIKNIHYLHEHQLIRATFSSALGRAVATPGPVTITSRGLDFLADDGGLSAILGVVTIKIHEDTIKQLIESRIADSDLPEEEKRPLLQAVRELPAEATKHLTTRLLDLGMDNLPAAVALLRTLMQSAG